MERPRVQLPHESAVRPYSGGTDGRGTMRNNLRRLLERLRSATGKLVRPRTSMREGMQEPQRMNGLPA